MDINIVFNILTVFNVIALAYSAYLINIMDIYNSIRMKIYFFSVFIIYAVSFLYTEIHLLNHGFIDDSDTITLVILTIATQLLMTTLWIINRLQKSFWFTPF